MNVILIFWRKSGTAEKRGNMIHEIEFAFPAFAQGKRFHRVVMILLCKF